MKRLPESIVTLCARIGGAKRVRTFKGREAWCLGRLLEAGERGVTPLDRPALRWSDYVFKLRRQGVHVETIHEGHKGAYAGRHARYVLRTPIELLSVEAA